MRVFISRLVEIGVKLQGLQRVLDAATKPRSDLFRVIVSLCVPAPPHPLPFQKRHKYNAIGSNLVKSLWEPVEVKDE